MFIDNNASSVIIWGDSRYMIELRNESIDLVVTSPPYWHIKDYGVQGQIGHGQSLHEYLVDLYKVWKECFRVLKPGRRLCINIGDQFASAVVYGSYKVIPLHAEIIAQCEDIGFDYMGSIIWQKKTTMNTSGGANVMGSYPYPPNGMIELDYEFIMIFKKPGKGEKVEKEVKERSKLSKDEWKEYFSGHWQFAGARQVGHEAMFPEELPKRLIRMFTFSGETVLDPFLGSGTTAVAALLLGRKAIGYEIQKDFLPMIREKFGLYFHRDFVKIIERDGNYLGDKVVISDNIEYAPRIKNAVPDLKKLELVKKKRSTYKVVDIIDESTIMIDNGKFIRFLGVIIKEKQRTLEYLRSMILGKEIYIKIDDVSGTEEKCHISWQWEDNMNEIVEAYVYLKNKIFINLFLIKSGLALADRDKNHKYKDKFVAAETNRQK